MFTFCISTHNNLHYLKIAVNSVRKNSFYKGYPFIIHAENCDDGTDEWLDSNQSHYNLEFYIDKNNSPKGIGGGMNFCAEKTQTDYINFLHSDFYVAPNWDKALFDLAKENSSTPIWVNSWRVEPQMFAGSQTTPGNLVVPQSQFGSFHHNFESSKFNSFAEDLSKNNDISIRRGLGVSGLIKKSDWNMIGGNDPIFAPTSWDDHDLFLRMHKANFTFITTSKSIVFHFGARGSHRLEENNGMSSERQMKHEHINRQKFINKWGGLPKFDNVGQIIGVE